MLLVKRLLIVLAAFTICRLLFIGFNAQFLPSLNFDNVLKCLVFGSRFDISVILLFNLPFIALHILPNRFRNAKYYQQALVIFFLLVNVPLIFLNLIDVFLYPFTLTRTTPGLLFIFETGEPFFKIFFSILKTYWFGFVILFSSVYLIAKAYSLFAAKKLHPAYYKTEWMLLPLTILLLVTGIRGGWQKVPISPLAANNMTGEFAPAILNTPYTFYYASIYPEKEIEWMNAEEAERIYPVVKKFDKAVPLQKKNVVVIMLESFSAEYTGVLNPGKGFTPFLDSLSQNSLLLTHCYANGKISIEGIPAVLSSVPSYGSKPFLFSSEAFNRISSFASLLHSNGYSSAFFHGGKNGTMNFDLYAQSSGYKKYYGMNEFTGDAHDSGPWGVDDEPFLLFSKRKIDEMTQPFHAAIFTLSSHHPFHLPEKYAGRFPKGEHPMVQTVAYTDFALRRFFEEASKTEWFKNTLFVFCADHTGPYQRSKSWNEMNYYHIFAMLYSPSENLRGKYTAVTQQTDLLPSVLDYLDYSGEIIAFGNSIFDSTAKRISLHRLNDSYSLIDSAYFLQYSPGWQRVYHYSQDKNLEHPKVNFDKPEEQERELLLKAVLQSYFVRMERNNLTVRKNEEL